jgi:WD40 repeat protein
MRGRQIGNWIGKREAGEDPPAESGVAEVRASRSFLWRWTPALLLLALIIAVGWWVRREGGYRRFISSLREGKVQSVEFQPYSNSAFVRISDERGIAAVAAWLSDAQPVDRRYGSLGAADCEMRIVMADGSAKRLWLGPTGPLRSGGNLVQSNTYVTLRGDGWQRIAFSNGLSAIYMRLPVSAQLPFNSIPLAPAPVVGMGIITTAPANFGEVDASVALTFLEREQFGQARRVLTRAIAADANNGTAQQFMLDTQARIRVRLPLLVKELEKALPVNATKLEREQYLQLRDKLMEAMLMAPVGDEDLARLRQRLSDARPEARVAQFKEVLRLAGPAYERYAIRDFAWSPDGATIATCGDDGRVRVWDALHGELLESFPAAIGKKIYFSDDGQKVWVWNDQGRTWWDVTTGRAAQDAKVRDEQKRFEYRAYAAASDKVGLTRTKDGQPYTSLAGHAGAVALVTMSPDGDQVASFGEDKVLSIWSDGPPRGIAELSPYERLRRLGQLEGPSLFLEDGSILTFRSRKGEATLKSGSFKSSFVNLPGRVTRVQFAARNQQLLLEMEQEKLAVVALESKKIYPITRPDGSCGQAGISPDGKTVAIANIDGSVVLVNVESPDTAAKLVCSPIGNRNWAAVQFSSDAGWVLACGVGFVSVWNTQTREQVFYTEKAATEGIAAAFTPDGKGMAIIYKDGGLRMLKSNLKESEAVGWDQSAMRELAFSKNGRWVATVTKTGEAEIFDSSASVICHIAAKIATKSAEPLQFNDDGTALLIKADDGSARLVEVPSGRELRRLTMKDVSNWLPMPASFSPDGKQVIAGPMVWGFE